MKCLEYYLIILINNIKDGIAVPEKIQKYFEIMSIAQFININNLNNTN